MAAAPITWIPRVDSTNDELRRRAAVDPGLPGGTAIATLDQRSGRGRAGREWVAPAGKSIACSVLTRFATPEIAARTVPWLMLLTGTAIVGALREATGLAGGEIMLKWPNDVLVRGRKVCGVLGEVASPTTAIVGFGINVTEERDELPVDTATSLRLEAPSAEIAERELAQRVLELMSRRIADLERADGDADASGLIAEARGLTATLGQPVRVLLPGGGELRGDAVDLDDAGRLVVRDREGGTHAVAVGDIEHVRTLRA